MSGQRKVNTVLLGMGIVVGALGAWFLSKKENRMATAKVLRRATTKSRGVLADFSQTAREVVADAAALTKQQSLDIRSKKKTSKQSKKK